MAKKKKVLSPDLALIEPINVFQKPLTFDFAKLFGAVGKALVHGFASKWPEFAEDVIDTAGAIGLQTAPGEIAYILVQKSLVTAVFTLLAESSSHLLEVQSGVEKVFFSPSGLEVEVTLGSWFLERPFELSIVGDTQRLLTEFLRFHGVDAAAIDSVVARFPSYFVYALVNEWRSDSKAYKPLLDALQTPFTVAGEREWAWATYAAFLNKVVNEGIFDEPFSLSQIFINPFAYYEDRKGDRSSADGKLLVTPAFKRVVVDLDQELLAWLKDGKAADSIRVISGGPGSGKSSFARIFAATIARQALCKTLFIPLHLIDPTRDLVDEVGRYVRDEGILPYNPLDPAHHEPLLVIFDGLDELASQGKASVETARLFLREVERTVERRNQNAARLRVLISGRELVVQENESEFRKSRQILTLLPYVVGGVRRGPDFQGSDGFEYSDPKGLLKIDLRERWWTTYGALTGREFKGLPFELAREDLNEITAQPLLNYLLALSFTRMKLDFSQAVGLNSIYADLVSAVYERGYERHRVFGPIRHMSSDDFVRVLEEIGLAAWHGDGRTTTVREIEEHCKASGVGTLLDRFKEGAEAGVTRLLAAFFFRQHGQRPSGDPTFIFTHKSFGEYLASRRIARAARRMTKELGKRSSDLDEGWTEKACLKHWADICGPAPISRYIYVFLLNELRLVGLEDISEMRRYFLQLFEIALVVGLPINQLQLQNFTDELFNSRNAEEALVACLNACSRIVGNVSTPKFDNPAAFGKWYKRIQEQRTGRESVLLLDCLSLTSFDGQCLDICDFWGSTLQRSSFVHASAHYTTFCYSDLTDANLWGISASLGNFERVDASRASFEGARLAEARFVNARLHGTNFKNAILSNADFSLADLTGADFTGAQIDRARFSGAIVVGTLLAGADILALTAENPQAKPAIQHVVGSVREPTAL